MFYHKVKVTFTLEQATKAPGGGGVVVILSLTSVLDGCGWLTPRPGRFIAGNGTRYPLYRRLDGPQGRSGLVREISHAPGCDP
jgi:hypothetical protein